MENMYMDEGGGCKSDMGCRDKLTLLFFPGETAY